MIVLNHVSKKYGNLEVLNNINLVLPDKGLICILGKSGSGKTTLLNLIGLLDNFRDGDIIVDGKSIKNLSKKEIDFYHFKYVSNVFQQYYLFDNLSVIDNIQIISKRKNIDDLLEYLGILDKKNILVKYLSGGEKQRVAIARALANDPKVILADEPTGALDSVNSVHIMDLLKQISCNKLVIVVTHNYDLAKKYADQIIEIKDGIVHQSNNKLECNNNYINGKVKIPFFKILNIVKNNILAKKKRNIFVMLSLFISFFSLILVLGISDGFISSIEYENKNSMSKFPIYISEVSSNVEDDFSNIFEKNNKLEKIYVKENNHINDITEEYVDNLKVINNNLEFKIFTYNIDDSFEIYSNNSDIYSNFDFLIGNYPIENNDVVILLNDDNTIDRELFDSIGLYNENYEYKDIYKYEYEIDNNIYTIVGIAKVKSKVNNIFASGIYYNHSFDDIPYLISLYPKNYENKNIILNYLNNYDVTYTDYANSVTNISKSLVNSIKYVLLCFSIISLLISIIMVSILSYISILERVKDIGIYKSLGMSNKKVKLIFYLENIFISFSSCFVSLLVFNFLSEYINNFLYDVIGLSNVALINSNNMINVFISSILFGIISSYFPLKNIKKYSIVEYINKN